MTSGTLLPTPPYSQGSLPRSFFFQFFRVSSLMFFFFCFCSFLEIMLSWKRISYIECLAFFLFSVVLFVSLYEWPQFIFNLLIASLFRQHVFNILCSECFFYYYILFLFDRHNIAYLFRRYNVRSIFCSLYYLCYFFSNFFL